MYEDPVSKFQVAVNSANASIRPYLLGVNNLNVEANLYDKIALGQPWGTEDLKSGIPENEIEVRLQALSTLVSYANALAAVASAKDVGDLQNAATSLGNNVPGPQYHLQRAHGSEIIKPSCRRCRKQGGGA